MAIIDISKIATLITIGLTMSLDQTMAAPVTPNRVHSLNKSISIHPLYSESSLLPGPANQTNTNDTADPGILLCGLPHWEGNCTYFIIPAVDYHDCLMVPTPGGWNSFGPDKQIMVSIYSDNTCESPVKQNIIHPGSHNLMAEDVHGTISKSTFIKVVPYDGVYLMNSTGGA